MKCEECGKEFQSVGRGRFCSGKCRVSYHRSLHGGKSSLHPCNDNPVTIVTKLEDVKSKIQAEKILEKEIVTKHKYGTENVELQETCQRLVNEGKLDACHIDLADWGFVDPNPGAESYFFPKKFKTQGVAQIKEGRNK